MIKILINNAIMLAIFWGILSLVGYSVSGGTYLVWFVLWVIWDLLELRWPQVKLVYWYKRWRGRE